MSFRHFTSFLDVLNHRKICPVCSNNLSYEITTDLIEPASSPVKQKIQAHFTYVLDNNSEVKTIFDITTANNVNVQDTVYFDFFKNRSYTRSIESSLITFEVLIRCGCFPTGGNSYEASVRFEIGSEFDLSNNTNLKKTEDEKFIFDIGSIEMHYERFRFCNVHFEDGSIKDGNVITIIQDYKIKKTGFSLTEVDKDGKGTTKAKQIPLVEDHFFKYDNSEKIYSRVRNIFLLQ